MAAFLVELKDSHAGQRRADRVIVSAATAADAKAYAKAKFGGDSPAAWDDATVTTLADVAANAPGLAGWRLRVAVLGMSPAIDITVEGTGANDTIDEIAALMVTALNATVINNAAYTAATQVLTIASGAGGDDLGDKSTIVEWYPPSAEVEEDVAIPGMVVSKVHAGAAADPLTATFAADTYVKPTHYRSFQRGHAA